MIISQPLFSQNLHDDPASPGPVVEVKEHDLLPCAEGQFTINQGDVKGGTNRLPSHGSNRCRLSIVHHAHNRALRERFSQ